MSDKPGFWRRFWNWLISEGRDENEVADRKAGSLTTFNMNNESPKDSAGQQEKSPSNAVDQTFYEYPKLSLKELRDQVCTYLDEQGTLIEREFTQRNKLNKNREEEVRKENSLRESIDTESTVEEETPNDRRSSGETSGFEKLNLLQVKENQCKIHREKIKLLDKILKIQEQKIEGLQKSLNKIGCLVNNIQHYLDCINLIYELFDDQLEDLNTEEKNSSEKKKVEEFQKKFNDICDENQKNIQNFNEKVLTLAKDLKQFESRIEGKDTLCGLVTGGYVDPIN